MRTTPKRDAVVQYAAKHGLFRAHDLVGLGVSPSYLDDLARAGAIEKTGRGLYRAPDYAATENHSLAEVASYVPECVICLLSALQYHEIGTQLPPAVWIALPNYYKVPRLPIKIEAVRMSAAALTEGVDIHSVEGLTIKIFSPAKTVADCFKFRSSVGMEVALEALKDVLDKRIATPADIYKYAKLDRVANVIEPYLEALNA